MQVAQVGAAGGGAALARAGPVDGAQVGGVLGPANVHLARPGEELAVAGVPCGHDAVEHVDAAADRGHQIERGADAHHVARLVGGHLRGDGGHRRVHGRRGLAHRESAERQAAEAELGDLAQVLLAELEVRAALHDAEAHLRGREDRVTKLGRLAGPAGGPLIAARMAVRSASPGGE